ncbi:carboxypeptidase-like regulatory domain-containing protein [Hymenobacter sp. BT559]|uniref:carboxypeptidase-like regulatory domain-containing protein n=1 Tax=Hymenobacter sp. BT559 TaxID=2795729 RepID=UPI0025730D6E|nr:carboxypeptidase-like regulatory domain-containing protein [Hymenobacter sp. BT559]
MKHLVRILASGLLVGFVSGGVLGCGVTSEVATTHPISATSVAIEPSSEETPVGKTAPGDPRASRPVAATARVAMRPPAETTPAASTGDVTAEARAVAIGSPTRRIQAGRILDEAGQPLVGATVLLKGTTRGTSTDANGDYSLPVPAGTNTFVFAYSGYEQEVAQSRDGQPLFITLVPAADGQPMRPSKASARRKR